MEQGAKNGLSRHAQDVAWSGLAARGGKSGLAWGANAKKTNAQKTQTASRPRAQTLQRPFSA
ncbi:hypothetical protein ADJ79_11980 [Ottowia sp. oral taxon 894]|nr:hypothetical protein ADJ79_11980 [Ottowia sp. oral taxon 894]